MSCFKKSTAPLQIQALRHQIAPTNRISTTKYTILTFLPLCLMYQFNRLANVYFLITAIVQSIPLISPLSPWSSILPLGFVLTVSLVREAVEQYSKYKYDQEVNATMYSVWINGVWVKKRSDQLQLGMVCKIEDQEIIPADLLVLKAMDQRGILYIETSSLDGEKALKNRYSIKELQNLNVNNFTQLELTLNEPKPNLYIFECTGSFNQQKLYFFLKNFLYRGSKLKNSGHVIGLIVFTGQFTKTMLNNGQDNKGKMSNIEKRVNYLMIIIFAVELALMTVCAVLRYFYLLNAPLIYHSSHGSFLEAGITFTSYLILLNTMIPISLLVSIEIIKTIQGYFIGSDRLMAAKLHNKIEYARTFRSSINEELGMIEYVFTDKTGTLTRNQMVMKKLVIGTTLYQSLQQKIFKNSQILKDRHDRANQINKLNLFVGGTLRIQSQSQLIQFFLFVMGICHECVINVNNKQSIEYQGPSPDEIALVDTARALGWTFRGNNLNKLVIQTPFSGTEEVELLQLNQFSSDRKRMSVMIRRNRQILLLMKGADNIIKKRLLPFQPFLNPIDKYVTQFSVNGLRTLLFCVKYISEEEFLAFNNTLKQIGPGDIKQKQKLIDEMQNNMMLIGTSAVEDKLQDRVPETIRDLLKANIKVCMLTGDKLQTAQNIGKSCNLINSQMTVYQIKEQSPLKDLTTAYRKGLELKTARKKISIIVEGLALQKIIKNIMFEHLLEIADSIICCRVTPRDKASVVELAKNKLQKITLSIGDGANDVQMIMQANVGIGLYGNEGMSAVQASDYAIPEFKALWRLLFVHGRWNYLRICELIKYFFYKNMVFTLPQFMFAIYSGYSGVSLYASLYLVMFNTIFTNFAVVIRALFEQDINYLQVIQQNPAISRITLKSPRENIEIEQSFIKHNIEANAKIKQMLPQLYTVGQSNLLFTYVEFFIVNFQAIITAIGMYYLIYFSVPNCDFWYFSVTVYTCILSLVTAKLCFQVQYWTWMLVATFAFTAVIPYVLFTYVDNLISTQQTYGFFLQWYTSPQFYFLILLSTSISVGISGVTGVLRVYYWPSVIDKARKDLRDKKRIQQLNQELTPKFGDIQMIENAGHVRSTSIRWRKSEISFMN